MKHVVAKIVHFAQRLTPLEQISLQGWRKENPTSQPARFFLEANVAAVKPSFEQVTAPAGQNTREQIQNLRASLGLHGDKFVLVKLVPGVA